MSKTNIRSLVGIGVLTAIVIVLQGLASSIRFAQSGAFSRRTARISGRAASCLSAPIAR